MNDRCLPALPYCWSALTWQQLCQAWQAKMHYGGNADASRAAALLSLCGLTVAGTEGVPGATGETVYVLRDRDGRLWTATAREVSHLARTALPWYDYPYGDPGEDVVKDEKGKVIKESREPVRGYVSGMHDAMVLPEEYAAVGGRRFSLPQAACSSLTWQQYRSLNGIAAGLFGEDAGGQAVSLQARFLAHILVPRSYALFDTTGGSIRLRLHAEYKYDMERADRMVGWWEKRLAAESSAMDGGECSTLFHIVFQAYQTAIAYYATVYPMLFGGGGKQDPLRDALTGEVGTINTVMKYAGYASQQEVYDSWLPFVFDILNTMTKEAKEIEKMNSRIRKK